MEILKNVPVKLNHVDGECTTPTGAAIVKTLSNEFIEEANFTIKKVAYGVGHKKFEKPNLLRAILCEGKKKDIVYEIHANIDDMSSEIYSYLFEKILNEGALDVYVENINMKKNRPAHKINILCKEEDLEKFTDLLITETSTFGVRYKSLSRKKLNRKFVDIESELGPIKVKLGYYNGKLIKAKPEYEQCKEIAFKENMPIKKVYEIINTNINEKIRENLLT